MHAVLQRLGDGKVLDEKLAEYAFFPLTHIFNEARRLSSRCLETATANVTILVSHGWRHQLALEMGKQLLILMTLVASTDDKQKLEPPSEELKVAAFECIGILVNELTKRPDAASIFNDLGSKSIVDQLAYLLLESVAEDPSEQVQLAASESLLSLILSISNRVLIASLLPRTASALTQSLRTSTKARRTRKVLISYLKLLTYILKAVLADSHVYPLASNGVDQAEDTLAATEALDSSWLKATSTQVNLVLIQVLKLRGHDHVSVREAVAELCFMIMINCVQSLDESQPLVIETVIFIAQLAEGEKAFSRLENESITNPHINTIITRKLHDWIQSMPRVMQANNDQVKQNLLGEINVSLAIAADASTVSNNFLTNLTNKILESVAASETARTTKVAVANHDGKLLVQAQDIDDSHKQTTFAPLLLRRSSQSSSFQQIGQLLRTLHLLGHSSQVAQLAIERMPDSSVSEKLSAMWLALQCLRADSKESQMLDFLQQDDENPPLSRPRLVSGLYMVALPILLEDSALIVDSDWRLTALAVECTILQAQLLGVSYRPELVDTLYPVLSLLASANSQLRSHAMAGLNLLVEACEYASTSDMLIENVDYLINAVGMKLNSFDVSPQAPQVLLMMLRLCGARIIPYIDDLIGSIFSGLDNFHGYPPLVELLFQVLKTVVNESSKQLQLSITNGLNSANHDKQADQVSNVDDASNELRKRSSRKRKHRQEVDVADEIPHRSWKTFDDEIDALDTRESQDDAEEQQQMTQETDRKLSKPHQLLLSIANATTPHLTSPSPRVRSILLELLDEISPLLAQDENSFLPLINAVWPAVVPRLLDYSDDPASAETTYNMCAAADTISTLCKGAGSFMSSRIDEIFPRLRKLFETVQGDGQSKSAGHAAKSTEPLVITKTQDNQSVSNMRTSRTQILGSLIRLLTAILSNVRVSADMGDEILGLLAPFSSKPGHDELKKVLQIYNADALWLWKRVH